MTTTKEMGQLKGLAGKELNRKSRRASKRLARDCDLILHAQEYRRHTGAGAGAQGKECVPFLESTSFLFQNPLQVVHN